MWTVCYQKFYYMLKVSRIINFSNFNLLLVFFLISCDFLSLTDDPNLEVFLSVILLARRENPAWVMNKLINQGFLALLQDTWNNYQISTDKTAKSALLKTIKLCINVLSATSRTIDELNKDKVTMIIHVLKKILSNSGKFKIFVFFSIAMDQH